MNPKHVLDFIIPEIEWRQIASNKVIAEYNKRVADYKALPTIKRFFSNNPETDYYEDFSGFWIDELEEIKREAEYKFKMKYEVMDIPNRWHNRFYKWAADNNIPF